MGDRDRKHTSVLELVGERRVVILDPNVDVPAHKMKASIPHQSSWQQSALTQDLETVADPEYKLSFRSKFFHRAHDWREPRKCSRPQIITVRKPARYNYRVKSAEV